MYGCPQATQASFQSVGASYQTVTPEQSKGLSLVDMKQVYLVLKKSGFPEQDYSKLGAELGLSRNTLSCIEYAHHTDDTEYLYLFAVLSHWFKHCDSVSRQGKPSYQSLMNALRRAGYQKEATMVDRITEAGVNPDKLGLYDDGDMVSVPDQPYSPDDLQKVLTLLKEAGFSDIHWRKLGLMLGLYEHNFGTIEINACGDTQRCLLETIDQWICRGDGASNPSLRTLVKGLILCGFNEQAEAVRSAGSPQTSHPVHTPRPASDQRPDISSHNFGFSLLHRQYTTGAHHVTHGGLSGQNQLTNPQVSCIAGTRTLEGTTGFSSSHLKNIIKALNDRHVATHKAANIGLQLGLLITDINAIEAKHRGESTRVQADILYHWLNGQGKYPNKPRNWSTLADALEVSNHAAAEKIRRLSMPADVSHSVLKPEPEHSEYAAKAKTILEVLTRCYMQTCNYWEFGLHLGLLPNVLDTIDRQDPYNGMEAVLRTALKPGALGDGKSLNKGILVQALRDINANATVDKIMQMDEFWFRS